MWPELFRKPEFTKQKIDTLALKGGLLMATFSIPDVIFNLHVHIQEPVTRHHR